MSTGTNNKVPGWLAQLGVREGEYFVDSKPRARRAMKSQAFSPAARIHICLGLHTMAFRQELAVKVEGGKSVPLTPQDICAETGIRREHFRRHMTELEGYGLADCKGSTKGRVEIYAWAVPRNVDVKKIVTARGDNFEWCPADLRPLLKHYRIRFSEDFVIARGDILELERLARVTMEAELSLRAYAKGLRAQAPPNKDERKGKKRDGLEEPSSSSPTVTTAVSVSQSADRPTDTLPPEPELEAIRQAIPEDLIEDLGEVPSRRLLQRIHAKLRGAPVEWLTQRIRLRRRIITSLGVIEHFAGDIGNTYQEIQRRRQRSSAAPLPPAPSSPEDIAALIAEARDILSDPQAGSGLHQWARDTLAAHANKTKTAGGGSS